jgi:hypothetical protein
LIQFIGARRDRISPVSQYQNLRDGKLRLSDAMFAQVKGWNRKTAASRPTILSRSQAMMTPQAAQPTACRRPRLSLRT